MKKLVFVVLRVVMVKQEVKLRNGKLEQNNK